MARAGQVRSRGAHLADHVALGVLTSVFPRQAVAAAVDAAGAREQRSRVLTAELTAYYVLGCALWQQESHEEVWDQLTEGLAWLDDAGADDDYVPASSSISEAFPLVVLSLPAAVASSIRPRLRGTKGITL